MQQAITWADVGPVLCHHMASLHNKLIINTVSRGVPIGNIVRI